MVVVVAQILCLEDRIAKVSSTWMAVLSSFCHLPFLAILFSFET